MLYYFNCLTESYSYPFLRLFKMFISNRDFIISIQSDSIVSSRWKSINCYITLLIQYFPIVKMSIFLIQVSHCEPFLISVLKIHVICFESTCFEMYFRLSAQYEKLQRRTHLSREVFSFSLNFKIVNKAPHAVPNNCVHHMKTQFFNDFGKQPNENRNRCTWSHFRNVLMSYALQIRSKALHLAKLKFAHWFDRLLGCLPSAYLRAQASLVFLTTY